MQTQRIHSQAVMVGRGEKMFLVMENSKPRLKENSTEYFGDL